MKSARTLFVVSLASLSFGYGVLVGAHQIFPYPIIKFGLDSTIRLTSEYQTLFGLRPTEFLELARHEGDGVVRFDPDEAIPGLTLMSGFFEEGNELQLISLDGSVVDRWRVRYAELFPDTSYILPSWSSPKTEWNVDTHGALALPDGSVVFNFEYAGTAKLDRCGEVQWTVPLMTHHSVEQSSDGGFWIPERRYSEADAGFAPIFPPYHEDFILKVSAEGEVVKRISVPGLLFKNNLQSILFANGAESMEIPEFELVHLNDIEELSTDMAESFPLFKAGDLLISLRDLNLVLVVDPVTEKVKWHQTGPWLHQHDPDFIGDGRISVFNNNFDGTTDGSVLGGSNIMTIDPISRSVALRYGSGNKEKMYTDIRGKHQYIGPNHSHILITESSAGRVFEVNSKDRIVWEYINRFDKEYVAGIRQATRYPEGYFAVDAWACQGK